MEFLFHLFQSAGFEPPLSPESLESEGFVHLSDSGQLLRTANRWFRDATDLKVMVLRAEQLQENGKTFTTGEKSFLTFMLPFQEPRWRPWRSWGAMSRESTVGRNA